MNQIDPAEKINNGHQIDFLGVPIHTYTLEETVSLVLANIQEKKVINHIVVNAAKLVYAKKSPILREALLKSDIVNADGQSIVWGGRLLRKKIPERVAGVDLFFHLLGEFEKASIPVYFLGATDHVLNRMIDKVTIDYPKLIIAGYRNGYFPQEEEEQICNMIDNSRAEALFLGISSPKKEIFLLNNSSRLTPYFRMGVGGSFDVLSGKTKRAPQIVQKAGLEWLYRIYQEPRRMWKRYAVTNTLYMYYLCREILSNRSDGRVRLPPN